MRRAFSLLLYSLIFITCAATSVLAQTSEGRRPSTASSAPAAQSDNRTSADESFELNITERRITERDFAASTSVAAGEETARGLSLRVGVAVGAEQINVLLRNVRGRVRFRASLERVIERLNVRRPSNAAP